MSQFSKREVEEIVRAMNLSQEPPKTVSRVEFEELQDEPSREKGDFSDLKVEIEVLYGKKIVTLKELSQLHVGELLSLDETGPLVEILANGKKIARGEVVNVDGSFGVRVVEFQENSTT